MLSCPKQGLLILRSLMSNIQQYFNRRVADGKSMPILITIV
jgi:hypothetical protein